MHHPRRFEDYEFPELEMKIGLKCPKRKWIIFQPLEFSGANMLVSGDGYNN